MNNIVKKHREIQLNAKKFFHLYMLNHKIISKEVTYVGKLGVIDIIYTKTQRIATGAKLNYATKAFPLHHITPYLRIIHVRVYIYIRTSKREGIRDIIEFLRYVLLLNLCARRFLM